MAYWAHVGGFLAGLLLISSFARQPVRRYYWEEEKQGHGGTEYTEF